MTELTIRMATARDAGLIAEMSRQTFYETFAAQNTQENMDKFMNQQFTREALMREVSAPGNIFFLAFDGHEAVGYVRMRENNNPPELQHEKAIEIARIYAATHRIGKGIGKALMEKAVEIARERGMDTIWLGVWEQNQRAIEFYSKWGFQKFNTHVFLLGDDPQTDWLMKKSLHH